MCPQRGSMKEEIRTPALRPPIHIYAAHSQESGPIFNKLGASAYPSPKQDIAYSFPPFNYHALSLFFSSHHFNTSAF